MLPATRAGWALFASTKFPVALSARRLSIAAHLAAPAPSDESDGARITVNGWVRSCRKQKNITFAVINDGSNTNGVQAVVPKDLDLGCSLVFLVQRGNGS